MLDERASALPTDAGLTGAQTVSLLAMKDVVRRTSLSRTSIYRLVDADRFPRPVRIIDQRLGWVAAEVDQWIADRIAQRDAPRKA